MAITLLRTKEYKSDNAPPSHKLIVNVILDLEKMYIIIHVYDTECVVTRLYSGGWSIIHATDRRCVYCHCIKISIEGLAVYIGHDIVGRVSLRHIYEIARVKSQDPNFAGIPLENICKTVMGSAKSLGIEVIR